MNHDELLAEIKSLNDSCSVSSRLGNALRAVVELHKPNWMKRCEACYEIVSHCDFINEVYPCPTIQAIEKELS